ncbi:MAG TPA: CHAT domain-containing protein [Pyrinomonadaceae bacterium]|nr:CHAT domain-containing protein [Pyrinomonadaceae bacterium]
MERKLLLPGIEIGRTEEEDRLEKFVQVEVKTARIVDPISRSAGDAAYTPLPEDVEDDDIVELEFENGERRWKQWMTVDQLRATMEQQASREGGGQDEPLKVPHTWEAKDPSRGWGTIALMALKVVGIDTDKLAEKGAQKLAAAIANRFESQLVEKQGHGFGLYRFTDPAKLDTQVTLEDVTKLTGSGPYLVFLHGTASSSVGSFGKLAETNEWKELQKTYDQRVLALEHRTFSVSPVQNALDLAALLPGGARLHLISHSRGGLVGELMCLAQAGDCRTKFADLTRAYEQGGNDNGFGAERERERKDLEKLWDLLLDKKLVVDRFVRVACPARGTTLASKRIDYLASGLLNAIGFVPVIKNTPAELVYDWLKSLLLTLVKKKADPRELPGIEAMSPTAPLIEFLNHPELSTKSDLGVIAGDIEVGNLKLTIPALIGNTFFWAKNDLVVNTKAMYDGIRREKAYYFFDQGSLVCHFNYFANAETRSRLNGWVLRKDDTTDEFFREVRREERGARDGQTVSDWLEQEEMATAEVPVYNLEVSMLHGDLRLARHPVVVGHYDGDGIVSAEKYLDRLLDGRLTDRLGMRLYPGPVGTAEVIYGEKDSSPGGALIVGLGDMGSINSEVVERGVMTVALRHALAVSEQPASEQPIGEQPSTTPGRKFRSAAFSALLIGTYGGNALRVKESVAAIVRGAINANRILYLQNMWDRVRIDRIELVELYEDVAIQAMSAVHELSRDQSSDFAQEVTVKVEPGTIRSVGGGRYQRPPSEFDTYWYGRIQITKARGAATPSPASYFGQPPTLFKLDPDRFVEKLIEEAVKTPQKRAQLSEAITEMFVRGGTKEAADGGLEFLVFTDRARIEASLQGTQRRLVDALVEQSTNKTRYEKDLSVSLYELLVPNALKDRTEHIILLLDSESAKYPWELVTDRTRPDEPVSTRLGLLRQFKTTDFRANPRPSRGNYAMVVGDTINNRLAPLPGAQAEAELVAGLMSAAGYLVRKKIKADGKTVINELFAREYQILHIAAHGIFNPNAPDESGVVLGDGLFLTAKELVNLRTVPDLVFINCCHLGKFSNEEHGRLETEYPHHLAASVAEELIKMGVKAVVAAGWAVDDAAAKKFAEKFYSEMLNGEAFGEAVRKARVATHREYAGTNTWGAYQCYGNPNFRLNMQGGRHLPKSGFYSRREYRDELRAIAERPDVQDEAGNQESRKRLRELEKALRAQSSPANLIADGEVLAELGGAWAALGNYAEAIKFYQEAIGTEDARASLKAVETCANLESRYAVQLWERRGADKVSGRERERLDAARRQDAKEHLDEAKKRFNWLLKLDATSERYALMGKVYKSLALISERKEDREANLKAAKEFYRMGYETAGKKDEAPQNWLYPATNYIACAMFLRPSKKEKDELTALFEEGKNLLDGSADKPTDFWLGVAKPDLGLVRMLFEGVHRERKEEIIKDYKRAFNTRVKPKEAESVLGQINFLIEMHKTGSKTRKKTNAVKTLGEIKSELLKHITSPATR